MKKQILILAFFVVAMMAGSLSSFGQLVGSTVTPQPLPAGCATDALHPRAGVPYDYAVLINNTADLIAAGTIAPTGYTWWATKETNFLTTVVAPAVPTADLTNVLTVTPGELIATGAPYADVAGPISMSITWSPAILAATAYQPTPAEILAGKTSTFVSVLANGSCSNNLQVFEIDPLPAFTVDIASIDKSDDLTKAWDLDVPQCVDVARSATYTAGNIKMDYGTNTLYFEVVSANFVTSWLPTFTIDAGSLSTVAGFTQNADISWYSTLALAKNPASTPIESFLAQVDGATIQGTVDLAAAASVTETTAGVSVYVKVVIHNNNYESVADKTFTLSVDGMDTTNQWDLNNSAANFTAGTPDCTLAAAADYIDKGVQTINPRPEIFDNSGPGVVAPSFVPKN